MENNNYYIILQNRNILHEYGEDDYHLEIIDPTKVDEVILWEKFHFQVKLTKRSHTNYFIVTNDKRILENYIFALNVHEFTALCRKKDYDKDMIRINLDFFGNFSFEEDLYNFFMEILSRKIISASMEWKTMTTFPYEDQREGVTTEYFEGWSTDKIFYYR